MNRTTCVSRCLSLLALGWLLLAWPATAWAAQTEEEDDKPVRYTAASMRATLLYGDLATAFVDAGGRAERPRSTPLAFGLSAAVPGLGQAYNRQWIKAALALGAEVALVAGYTTWRSRGVEGREAYQDYAHQHWSPVRYADWLNDYTAWLETEKGASLAVSDIEVSDLVRAVNYTDPDTWTPEQRSAIRSLFNQIRTVEDNVFHPETGAAFSHKLPYFAEQQYYELIGKYFQFAPGWEDYEFLIDEEGNATWVDEEGNFIASIDPEATGANGTKPFVSPRFLEYADDHGAANDYLRRASRISIFFFANHLLAAVDAAVFSKLHNQRLQARLELSHGATGDPEPGASLRFTF